MDTNLKNGKKIRAFCYRMFATAALLTAIATAVMGREALVNMSKSNWNLQSVSGDLYDLAEFREYIDTLYQNAMIGYAGIGDDNGYPLTDSNAIQYGEKALEEFRWMARGANGDILYYIKVDDMTVVNNFTSPLFSEYDGHLLLPEGVRLCCYWNGADETLQYFERNSVAISSTTQYKPNKNVAADMQVIIAVKEDCTSNVLSEMEARAAYYNKVMVMLGVSLILWIVFGVCALFSGRAARQAKADYTRMSAKVWFEAKLVFIGFILYLAYLCDLFVFDASLNWRMCVDNVMWLYFPMGCLLYMFFVDLQQNKGNVFLNSFPVKIVCYVKEFLHGVSWYRKGMVWNLSMLVGAVLLLGTGVYVGWNGNGDEVILLGIPMLTAGILLFYAFMRQRRFLQDTALVVHKLAEMKEGRGNVPLELSSKSLLVDAAKDLNELEDGIENAVEQRNRSNRMKVELLTNVSHDLKTPLTSIVNYADLLCEEELPDTAAEYASALQQKAYRLKKMVQDVFDLSKATSGNLVVEKAVIDLAKLIKQTLADMDERISESTLTFKWNVSKEPLFIEADGEKLYRVFQNLFVNALQYSLENSRVHIQIAEEDGFAVARVKNVSRMELDFDTTEIVERFVRADSSRTTEGSGLGLSIVQSFTEACGGQFVIETDADMFTACVRFPLTGQAALVESAVTTESTIEPGASEEEV